ncbi:unnamed protein product [Clonostachys rhizophaga]|uniref:BZIP domain-containing protein n=1 Tax=Clonostachys rhizophaga TaxID=160324 RepID=A0A9N9V649_9HYPO|nr:unnamed protein product [Clonostachys rhizophaga]
MDFSNQYQFAGTQPAAGYNPFMSVAPLTPSRSQSDDYNGSSPEVFDSIPANDGFQTFDYPQSFSQPPQQSSIFTSNGGPPTPPNQSAFGQQHSNSFANGNPSFGHAGVAMTGADLGSQNKSESDEAGNGRAGSEEENMTPAQSKRKAQNRAAQRAFRERKEKHVKDLEAKLADLEAAQQQASVENERLKRDLQKVSTENEILKATTTTGGRNHLQSSSSPEPLVTGPMRYNPTEFASSVLQGHQNKQFSHRIVQSSDGQSLYAAGAAWDFIISHEFFKRGLVDIINVSEHLRTRAVCDGQGPVFSEKDIVEAIQLSVANGTDNLI